MKTLLGSLVLLFSLILFVVPAAQAQPAQRVSPLAVTTARYDAGHMSVYYSRPAIADPRSGEPRVIWGGLVPYGQVWRTGANEATLLVTQNDLRIGETLLPAGAYTLFTLPEEDGTMSLIINKQVGQWGSRYNAEHDLVRLPMQGTELEETVDRFTLELKRTPETNEGTLTLSWEKKAFSIGFTYGG